MGWGEGRSRKGEGVVIVGYKGKGVLLSGDWVGRGLGEWRWVFV